MTSIIQARCSGCLWGLAAGDKNGGPIRMAVLLGESLISCEKYNREDVISRYMKWYLGEDEERCFDTGNTFWTVFSDMKKGITNEDAAQSILRLQPSIAGVNAAHRSVPISLAAFIDDSQLSQVTQSESTITHLNQLSIQTAIVVNTICRDLIKGSTWTTALERARNTEGLDAQIRDALVVAGSIRSLDRGGFAPEVLKAAVFFTNFTSACTFEEVLQASLNFAGEVNFCPVIVGAFCGALYGKEAIPEDELLHHRPPLIKRINQVASALASKWQ